MTMLFAAVHESLAGTKRTSQSRALMSALWGNADITWKRRHFRF
jgi:hypothetical protein